MKLDLSKDPRTYPITIQYGEYEGDWLYRATTPEFPDLVSYRERYAEAYQLQLDAIETMIQIFKERELHATKNSK